MSALKRTPMPFLYLAGSIFHDDPRRVVTEPRPLIATLAADDIDPAQVAGNGHMLAAAPHMLLALNLILADLESDTPCSKAVMAGLCKTVIAKAMGEGCL
jgi:hypothetical protein